MVWLNCCKSKTVFDSFKIEIVTEKLVCNNQKGNEEKLSMLNTYENLPIYPTGKDMGKNAYTRSHA